jgi:hypothetical protein
MRHICAPLILLIAVFVSSGSLVFAHGSSYSHEEVKDGYLIDIGFDEFIAVDESMRFDFSLYPQDIDSVEGKVFTDVWVTITKDRKIFFAGGVHKPVFGTTGFTYVFPHEGEYVFTARYQKEGNTIVSTEFPLTVLPSLEVERTIAPVVIHGIAMLAGLLIGLGLGLFIPRKREKNL